MNKHILIIASLLLAARAATAQHAADSIINVQEVTVTAALSRTDLRTAPMNVNIIGNNAIEQRHTPSLLPLVVEETAGMFAAARGVMGYGVSGGGAGTMSVRGIGGAPTTGVLVLIDGHPQFMGMMGHPLADAYQSLAVERVEVALGPASSLYGSNAMGGVINIITQKQQQDGSSVRINSMYGSYNTSSTDMTAAMRKGKLHALLAASMNQTDGHREFMNFKQYSGYGKLGFDYINNWRAWGDVDITHFNSDAPSRLLDGSRRPIANMDRGAKADVMRYVASFVVENNYDKTSGALKFYYNYGEHFVKDRDTTTNALSVSPFKSNDYAWGINAYQSYNIFENTEISAKVDYMRYGGKAGNYRPDEQLAMLHADTAASEIAGYLGIRQNMFNKRLSLSAGARFDYNDMFGGKWIPQGGIIYSMTENTTLKAIAGKGFRNPTIRETFMFAYNANLKSEEINSYELMWTQDLLNKKLNFTMSGYYISGSNTIVTGSQGKPENSGSIENWGIELASKCRINDMFSVHANYAYLNMRNPVLAAPEHKAYGGVNFAHGRWSAAAGMQYVANLYTALATNAAPAVRQSFALLNARIGCRLYKWANIFIKGENLLNQKYEINAGYPMPGATFYGGLNLSF